MPARRRRKQSDSGSSLPPEFGSLPEPTTPPPSTPEPTPPAFDDDLLLDDDIEPAEAAPEPTGPEAAEDDEPVVIDLTDPPPAEQTAEQTTEQEVARTTTSRGAGATAVEAPPTPTSTDVDTTDEIPEWGASQGWAPDAPAESAPPDGPPRWGPGTTPGDIAPPPPPPERRPRRRIWPWFVWLGVLFLPVAVIIVGIAVAASFNPGPVDAANDFIAALDEGRFDDAYDRLCPATRREVGPDMFTQELAGADQIEDYRVSGTATLFGSPPFDVDVTIRLGNRSAPGRFQVDEIDGEWRICSYYPLPEADD
jgi:hypothetical protein